MSHELLSTEAMVTLLAISPGHIDNLTSESGKMRCDNQLENE